MFAQLLSQIFQIKQNLWFIPYKIYSKKRINSYLKEKSGSIRLNMGSGANLLSGWLNGEIWPYKGSVYIDVSKKLPFKENTVYFINCEHLVEHLSHKTIQFFLKECFRVLRKEGILRIATPDLKKLIQLYLGTGGLSAEKILTHHRNHHNSTAENMCVWFNDYMRLWGHQFVFDEPALIHLLEQAGFSQIIQCKFGESQYPELRGVERHIEAAEWMMGAYLMIFEACK
jgi:predicted SAM-dependent methyltransferase